MPEHTSLQQAKAAAKVAAKLAASGSIHLLQRVSSGALKAAKRLTAPATLEDKAAKAVSIPEKRAVTSQKIQMTAYTLGSKYVASPMAYALKGSYGLLKGSLGFKDRVASQIVAQAQEKPEEIDEDTAQEEPTAQKEPTTTKKRLLNWIGGPV